jgi:hypothetical protein
MDHARFTGSIDVWLISAFNRSPPVVGLQYESPGPEVDSPTSADDIRGLITRHLHILRCRGQFTTVTDSRCLKIAIRLFFQYKPVVRVSEKNVNQRTE